MNVSGRARSFIFLICFLTAANDGRRARSTEPSERIENRTTSLTAEIDNLVIRIDGAKLWTLSRIEDHGTLLGVEHSAYGTVINIQNVGFIGTAHREVETEEVTELDFQLDGEPVAVSATNVRGSQLKITRKSRIRSFQLDSILEIRDRRLFQSVRIRTADAVDLKVMYPFMYAWTPTATEYLFGADDGSQVPGIFLAAAPQPHQFDQIGKQWFAVYDGPSGRGAVSRVLARSKVGESGMRVVDAPEVYRKFYLMCFAEQQVPAGFDATYEIVTGFFQADKSHWQSVASQLAKSLVHSTTD